MRREKLLLKQLELEEQLNNGNLTSKEYNEIRNQLNKIRVKNHKHVNNSDFLGLLFLVIFILIIYSLFFAD